MILLHSVWLAQQLSLNVFYVYNVLYIQSREQCIYIYCLLTIDIASQRSKDHIGAPLILPIARPAQRDTIQCSHCIWLQGASRIVFDIISLENDFLFQIAEVEFLDIKNKRPCQNCAKWQQHKYIKGIVAI